MKYRAPHSAGDATAPMTSVPAIRRADLAWLSLWMTGTLLSFAVMAISVRTLATALSAFEMMSFRSAFGLAVMVALGAARGSAGGFVGAPPTPARVAQHAAFRLPGR